MTEKDLSEFGESLAEVFKEMHTWMKLQMVQNNLTKHAICDLQDRVSKVEFTTVREKEFGRPHGKCKTCKYFVKGGLDGKTYVCEQPDICLDDHFDYACIMMDENDFCSRYVPREGDPDDRA